MTICLVKLDNTFVRELLQPFDLVIHVIVIILKVRKWTPFETCSNPLHQQISRRLENFFSMSRNKYLSESTTTVRVACKRKDTLWRSTQNQYRCLSDLSKLTDSLSWDRFRREIIVLTSRAVYTFCGISSSTRLRAGRKIGKRPSSRSKKYRIWIEKGQKAE